MNPIPHGRATTLIPFVSFLSELGAPVEPALEGERLPLGLLDQPGSYIPTRNNWAFIDRMAGREGIPDLGLRVSYAAHDRVISADVKRRLRHGPTLFGALEKFCANARRESSGMRCWLVSHGDVVRFHLSKTFGTETPGYAHTEWLGLLAMLQVVRPYAGTAWSPPEMSLQSVGPPPELAGELFPETRILMEQPASYLALPRGLLSLPLRSRSASSAAADHALCAATEPGTDLVGSIREIVRAYLPDGYPCVEMIAGIAEVSVRTLQRHLAAEGVSHSELVESVRLEQATFMLAETDAPSLDIAHAVGYRDPSNFARAFRRATGMSPREFRRRSSPSEQVSGAA